VAAIVGEVTVARGVIETKKYRAPSVGSGDRIESGGSLAAGLLNSSNTHQCGKETDQRFWLYCGPESRHFLYIAPGKAYIS
jgi:hypothetical protein